jgi:tmRNA-binding protein
VAKANNKPGKGREASKAPREQVVAQNRAASYHYHILEKLEAGLVLHGTEVKALREGKANIRDAYVDFKPSGPYLVNAHIAQYMPGDRGITSPSESESCFFIGARFTSLQAVPNRRV